MQEPVLSTHDPENTVPSTSIQSTSVPPTSAETEKGSTLYYDSNTGKAIIHCALTTSGVIPGWILELSGWRLSNEVLAAIWARTRKIMRIYGVDAVALFGFNGDDSPTTMTLLPETSRLRENEPYVDYARRLAKTLDHQILPQFGIFLEKAQRCYNAGYPLSKIVETVCSHQVIDACIGAVLATPEQRISLCREARKRIQKEQKAAGVSKREARERRALAEAAAIRSREKVETADAEHRADAIRRAERDEAAFRSADQHYQEVLAQAQIVQQRCRQNRIELNRYNNPMVALQMNDNQPIPLDLACKLNGTVAEIAALVSANQR